MVVAEEACPASRLQFGRNGVHPAGVSWTFGLLSTVNDAMSRSSAAVPAGFVSVTELTAAGCEVQVTAPAVTEPVAVSDTVTRFALVAVSDPTMLVTVKVTV
jgi:hypothetical protein